MKIALYYPHNWLASWYTLGGYANTLRDMGHEVIDCPFPGNLVHDVDNVRSRMPTIDQLNSVDCILLMFMEYIQPWLASVYGLELWKHVKVPIVARYDESFDRQDLGLFDRWEEFIKWAPDINLNFFPAHQDAERYGGQWLVYGADLIKFHCTSPQTKKYDLAFVGSFYPLRQQYLAKLSGFLGNDVTFNVGQAIVQDLSGIRSEESTDLLAENYRQIKIFFCLPPMSRLLVCKVFEVMACGTFVMFPMLPGDAAHNCTAFNAGLEIVYYEHGYMKKNAEQIQYYLTHEEERETIANAGRDRVYQDYTLQQMLERMLWIARPDISVSPRLTFDARRRLGIGTDVKPVEVESGTL